LLLAAGIAWRRQWFVRHRPEGGVNHLVAAAPWLLAGCGACLLLTGYLPEWPPALITRLVLGILTWYVFSVLLRIWLAGRESAGLAKQDAISLGRWLRILAGLVILGGLISTAEAVIQLPDPHYFTLRTGMAWLLLVGLVWSAIILGRVPGLAGTRGLRVILVLVVLTIVIAETAGFRNLSIYLMQGFSGTIIGFGVFRFIARSFVFLFDGLDEGQYLWQQSIRKWMDLQSHEPVPGLVWLRLATSLLVWLAFVIWVLWLWGQSERWIGKMVEYATEGFSVGSLHISPMQILGGIAVLSVGISLTRWIKLRVISDLVRRTRLDRGGREAIVTVSGYVGVTISLLIALGIAGISYTNLAIVAGALSVGIGFGLQNVVNNFVSGLILLFERPVRTGDWIVVGDTQGYVRKISIRSTQIQTFDRADVIVPNSELISNKVSNWMLNDPWGRLRIPVGVAYGSDVGKVISLLVQVANEHEGVMKDQPGISPPKAFFRQFGDSALEFELRCFIRQIDRIIEITSDLNIAIDKAFREADITIPFPQRDIHVKAFPPDGAPGSL
jgi:small-conductance mechanosensitive channel